MQTAPVALTLPELYLWLSLVLEWGEGYQLEFQDTLRVPCLLHLHHHLPGGCQERQLGFVGFYSGQMKVVL